MVAFITQQRKYLDSAHWLELTRGDLADNVNKWAMVGGHKHGKVYIQLGTGRNSIREMHLLSVDDVHKFLRGRQDALAIGSIEDSESGKWFAEARLVRLESERAAVVLSVKVSSERQVWSDQIELRIEGSRLKPGEVTHVSGTDQIEDQEDADYSDLIPAPVYTGPMIPIREKPLLKRHASEGQFMVDMINGAADDSKLQNFVIVGSDAMVRDGAWNHYVTIPAITFVNRDTNKAMSVLSTELHFQDNDGQWQLCKEVRVGDAYRGHWGPEFRWFEDGTNFNLEAGTSVSFAVRGAIPMTVGKPGNDNYTRSRLHDSLPHPLLLRVSIHGADKEERSLTVEVANDTIDLPNKEKYEKSWKVEILSFISADDVANQERIWAAVYPATANSEERVVFRFSYGKYFTYGKQDFNVLEYKASESSSEEIQMDNLSREESSSGRAWKVTALFDKTRKYRLYGMRFSLKTGTSSAEQVVLLPKLK